MADLDLGTALQMFQQGAKEMMFQRALGQANDAVQQVKASDLNDQEKFSHLQQISNSLITHMAGMSIPATTMQMVSQALTGPHFENSNQMNAYAVQTGDQQLAGEAQKQQNFEQNPANKIALIQAKAQYGNPLAIKKFENEQSEFETKELTKVNTALDPSAASSRSAFGLTGQAMLRADRIKALIGNPANWSSMNKQDATLIGEGLSNLVKGGVATEQEINALVPRTSGTVQSDVQQFLTNKPQGAQLEAFIQKYNDIIDRETAANQSLAQDTILKRASGLQKIAQHSDSAMQQFKVTVAQNLSKAGIRTEPEDVTVDPKKGVSTVQMDKLNGDISLAQETLQSAYKDFRSNSPEQRLQAMKVFGRLGINPDITTPSQARKLVETRIRTGGYGLQ